MLYPFKYNLSATSGYFYLTMSSDIVYYQYEPVNLEKLVIPSNKKEETS
ncbi:hypothetical protein [Methanosarcina vacuolata]|nr:hypothetical protein [Methanosarcina vacuolata]